MTSKDLKNIDFIDFHTHKLKGLDKTMEIYSYNPGINEMPKSKNPYSTGLHPWNLEELVLEDEISRLESSLLDPSLLFLGETGLDKVTKTNSQLQSELFQKHIQLSIEFKKPLVLHCVKAYYDIISVRSKYSPKELTPWIFHDYNGNEDITKKLLADNYFFSLGPRFFTHKNSKISKFLQLIPLERVFFETDDTEIPIEKVYLEYAKRTGVQIEHLKEQIISNFKNLMMLPL